MVENHRLSPKVDLFCHEYLKDLNGTKAAIRAGYSAKTAQEQASRLLSRVIVSSRVNELQKNVTDAVLVDVEYVIKGLKQNAERCQQAQPVMRFNPVEKQMEQVTEVNDQGEEVGVWQFDSQGANRALELLGKHVGAFEADNLQKRPLIQIALLD